MKKPLYNMLERWEIREFECLATSFMKLNISYLKYVRLLNIKSKVEFTLTLFNKYRLWNNH